MNPEVHFPCTKIIARKSYCSIAIILQFCRILPCGVVWFNLGGFGIVLADFLGGKINAVLIKYLLSCSSHHPYSPEINPDEMLKPQFKTEHTQRNNSAYKGANS